ncbi:MAG TPA: DUF3047 domain-containing protein [Vicinamibacteria bacterium]|jgi:hypothetical protein
MVSRRARATLLALVLSTPVPHRAAGDPPGQSVLALDVRAFRPVEGPTSGPAVYYHVVDAPEGPLLRGAYRPGLETVTMGFEIPENLRQKIRRLRWSWRARAFPEGGNECRGGRGDSAASVSVAWKRGLKWYVLKYVWSSVAPLGEVCDRKRTLLLARDTIILESGGATGRWLPEVVDVRRAFIDHFAGGDAGAEIPDLVGVGLMTDGDQTNSESGADWARFEVVY